MIAFTVLTHLQISPARQARSYPEPSGPRKRGFVERFREHYGFIRWILAALLLTACCWSPCTSLSHVASLTLLAAHLSAPLSYVQAVTQAQSMRNSSQQALALTLEAMIRRSIDREQHSQLFFHISEVRLESDQAIEAGSEVSFATVPDTQGKGEGNPIAVRVQLLPDGTLEADKRLPGRCLLSHM